MRAGSAIAAVGLVALAAAGCADNTTGAAAGSGSGPIKVGVVLEVTGVAASIGGPERDAVQLAAKQINDAGGVRGRRLELVVVDAQSREDEAAKDASVLVDDQRVSVLIGSSRSGPSLAMRPIAERAKVPMISLAASQRIVDSSSWVFKTPPNDRTVIAQLTGYLAGKGYRRIGLLRDASAFGEGVAGLLDASGRAAGLRVVREEKFAPDATDFTAQLVRLRDVRADAYLVWGSAAAPALATKAYRQLGLTAPLLSSYGVATTQFLGVAGPAAEGVVLNGNKLLVADQLPAADPQKKVLADFVAAYRAATGKSPTPFAGYAYDAVRLAADALAAVGDSPAKVRDYLERRRGFVGVTGQYSFSAADHSGLSSSPLVMLVVRGGRFELLGR
jgi:branched-chain amino acid transport system substrate-binding protein